jgi:alkylation response protein AidB-like acyl-CoA dehydrogenase
MRQDFFNRDIAFFIEQRVDWERYFALQRTDEVTVADEVETFKTILGTLGAICQDLDGAAHEHWHEEVRLEAGRVVPPPHIEAGYEKLRAAGLVCLTLSPEYGGYGLPLVLNCAYLEMLSRADPSLMTIVGLQAGAAMDIERYGSGAVKQEWLPRFVRGEVQGCMDLTEPHAGSDLGGITTRVTREGDRCVVDGQKIFITNGGAAVHLVLAREGATFEASRGTTNGLSLVLVPTTRADGAPNGVSVPRVETKLGIHGSPTCVVDFDGAEGVGLGTPGDGFRAMLDLMNNARLGVAAQAIGIAEGAYRAALAYTRERVQFGAPIFEQPMVKSMLTQMAINVQGARALLYRTAALIDMTDALRTYLATDRPAERERATLEAEVEQNVQLSRFLTPLCKYYATEISSHVTRQGIQLHGGLGYMAESPVGHYHSDAIITTIYEGTSEIQASFALKEMAKGALVTALETTKQTLAPLQENEADLTRMVIDGIGWLTDAIPALLGDPKYALLNAKRICEMVIDVVVAAELLQQAALWDAKRELAASFIHRRMLSVQMNARRISTGDASRLVRYERILEL